MSVVSTSAALSDLALAKSTYIGKPVSALPSPAFILDKARVTTNIARMLTKISDPQISAALSGVGSRRELTFRPHVKTLKSEQVTRASLGYSIDGKSGDDDAAVKALPKSDAVVASTLAEIRGLRGLVEEGLVKDIIYGVPFSKSHLPELAALKKEYGVICGGDITLFVDDVEQLKFLESEQAGGPWKLIMKIDANEHRAGTQLQTPEFETLVRAVSAPSKTAYYELRGFYAHAGASYDANDLAAVQQHLARELGAVTDAAASARALVGPVLAERGFLLSIGATPTAHALSHPDLAALAQTRLHARDTLELHAGNFVALDLQQVSTSLAARDDVAGWVLADIVSYYARRGGGGAPEYLLNAGVLALTREPGHGDPAAVPAARGLAQAKDVSGWIVSRVSQEHGILEYVGEDSAALKPWSLGDKVALYPQHACIVAAMHQLYFIVDGGDIVVDVWQPWKFW